MADFRTVEDRHKSATIAELRRRLDRIYDLAEAGIEDGTKRGTVLWCDALEVIKSIAK
mgnify:CR=1 FL=1